VDFHGQASSMSPNVGPPLVITIDGVHYPIGKPPSIKQWAFIERDEQEQLYGGSKSGGKSRGICAKLITLATEFPGNQLGLFRQNLTDLKGSTLVTFEQTCPKQLILTHHKTDNYFLIRTKHPDYPSRIWYGGLGGNEGDFEKAKGKEYGAFAIDEPSEIDRDTYLQMLAQLRWTLPEGIGFYDAESNCWRPSYQAILGSNPEPGWVEEHFGHLINVATEREPIVTDRSRVYIMALPKDNPYNPPNYEQKMREQPDIPQSWIDKYMSGSWKASEGLVFKELDEATHCIKCPDPKFLSQLTLVGSLDHASTGIVCFCINGIDSTGNVFALASYYHKNRLISQHSQAIRDMCDDWMRLVGREDTCKAKAKYDPQVHWSMTGFEYILIDPSTQQKTLQNKNELWSAQDMYQREGIPTQAAWNAVDAGVALMQEYIHPKPAHLHPITGKRGAPNYFIVREFNREGIKEIEGWKKTITINKSTRYVGPDHWIDNQRYIIMSRPEPPKSFSVPENTTDTHTAKANATLDKFLSTFGKPPSDNQWFEGGGKSKGNQWFPNL